MVMSLEEGGSVGERVEQRLKQFQLTTAAGQMGPRLCQAGHTKALTVIGEVLDLEAEARQQRRIARLRSAAQLPPGKTWETFDGARLPVVLQQRLVELRRGEFLDRAVNVLSFGLPGVGKSHAACALGQTLVEQGHSVLFRPAYQLVQELLAAKRDLTLPRLLHKLDAFELLVVD
jgi:DNA replication protein DnaC